MSGRVGCILPSGNAGEFPLIESSLEALGVVYKRVNLRAGGAVFLVEEGEIGKLPVDEDGYYLPVILGDRGSGHGMYPVDDEFLSTFV